MIVEVAQFVGQTIAGLYQVLNAQSIEIGPNISVTMFTLIFWLPFTMGVILAVWEATIGGVGEGLTEGISDYRKAAGSKEAINHRMVQREMHRLRKKGIGKS